LVDGGQQRHRLRGSMNFDLDGKRLMRIHVIGGPASGKTELAYQLGARLGMPTYELDRIAFEGLDFNRRPLGARCDDVKGIAASTTWITEGMFLEWSDLLLEKADLIIWLDCVQWPGVVWRIMLRFVRWGIQEARRQPGIKKISRFHDYARNLRHLVIVLRSSKFYYEDTTARLPPVDFGESRAVTAKYLTAYSNKLIHCRRKEDLEELLAQIGVAQTRDNFLSHAEPSPDTGLHPV